MVRSFQKGDLKNPSSEVTKIASTTSKSDVKKMASTKHEGLPLRKIKEEIIRARLEGPQKGLGAALCPICGQMGCNKDHEAEKEEEVTEGKVSVGPRLGEPRTKGSTAANAGQGEKIQKRTLKWMRDRGQTGAPGLNAMKERQKEHEAKRGVKEEVEQMDEIVGTAGGAIAGGILGGPLGAVAGGLLGSKLDGKKKKPEKKEVQEEDYNYVTEYAAALGALAKGVGKTAVRQGIKVGGKAGGRAVQAAGRVAKDAAVEAGTQAATAGVERAGEAAGNAVRNIGRKKPEPETDVEEGYQRNPEKGEKEEKERSKNVRGERTPMPPRGDKRREEFEKWMRTQGM